MEVIEEAIKKKQLEGLDATLHVICDACVRYAPSVGAVALLQIQTYLNAEMRVRIEMEREKEERQKQARPRITKRGTERFFRAGAFISTLS